MDPQRIHGLVVLLILSLSSLAHAAGPASRPSRPNVLMILSDDQGFGDLSLTGNTNLSTPNIDGLAKQGAFLERFYVCPVCSPTRAEFLTGRYHPRGGVHGVSTGGERLNLDETTIADAFKAAGYKTGAFGKWHNGTQYPYHPNGRGFEEYYGFTSGHWGTYFDPPLDHNGEQVKGKGFIIDDLTDHAMRFMEQNKDRPFFCYVPLNTPHSPMQMPDAYWNKFAKADVKLRAKGNEKEDLDFTRAVLGMCENIDWNVGRLLAKLDELKLADDTIVLYFSDNGPNSARWNAGMKGKKGSVDEGGVRSPLVIRYPGKIPANVKIPQIAGAIDLLPTLADFAGVALPNKKPLDGVSLKPLLSNPAVAWPDRMIFSHWAGKVSVRTQQYRLDNAGALFDMVADPGQTKDVAKTSPAVTAKLTTSLDAWKKEMLPGLRNDSRPFPVGYAEFPNTWLPARDGVPQGGIQRSANAPNCSYFTNWTKPADAMTWDVEVVAEGRYEVTIYYACAKEDVGSTIELRLGNAKLSAKVAEANDVPATGMEHDRVTRKGESYIKDWKPMRMGEIHLKAGAGQLTLQATTVAGRQVMEVRQIALRRLQ